MASQYGEATLRTVWARIHGVLTKTILTSLPTMRTSYRELYPDESFAGHCFQLLGFDIMLDSELRPWLIEVNRNPSLRCDTPLDQKIKTAVLAQTFYILDASGYIKRLFNAERHAVSVLIQYVRNATQNSQSPTSSSTSPTSHQQQQSRSVSIDLAILTSLGLDPAHLPRNVAEKHLSRSEVISSFYQSFVPSISPLFTLPLMVYMSCFCYLSLFVCLTSCIPLFMIHLSVFFLSRLAIPHY